MGAFSAKLNRDDSVERQVGERYSSLATWIETRPWYRDDAITAAIRSLIRGRPKRVLELCCGAGLLLETLARHYSECEFVGVDISSRMVALAEHRLHSHGNVQIKLGNWIYGLPEELIGGGFDLIVVKNALHLLEDPVEMLSELRSVATRSAELLVIETVSPNVEANKFIRDLFQFVDPDHLKQTFFTKRSLTTTISASKWYSDKFAPVYISQHIELIDWLRKKCPNKEMFERALAYVSYIKNPKVRASMHFDAEVGRPPHHMLRLQYLGRHVLGPSAVAVSTQRSVQLELM